jgi:metal-dependent hydrolase (beta-lactamase superfamily II)
MKRGLTLYAGEDHFLRRFTQRGADRVNMGRLHREEIERYDIQVESVRAPLMIADGVLLSGEMHEHEAFETIPENLRVEREGQIVPDAFLGEQTMITNVRGRGLVVVTSCSHRGIVGICRHAARITGVPKVHAVIGGFHLSGLREERVTRVVDAFRDLEVDWIVPQHCTGLEAMASMMHRLPREMVPSQDQSRVMVRLQIAVGANLAETDRVFSRAEAWMQKQPEVNRVFGAVGGGGGSVNSGILFVTMVPANERKRSQADFSSAVRKEFNSYPGVRASVQDAAPFGYVRDVRVAASGLGGHGPLIGAGRLVLR